ncbi:hypothetical protein ACIQU6_26840 [Streptomyces sp. NPDC090442]|uniref:hypothetical protein n=1 Tax=Streptomyces sp. NPDC090442 TaxID=3365962 RepID=UPI00382017BB
MASEDPKEIVRRGYDAASHRYDEAYGAVVSFYALIHIPLAEQPPLLRSTAEWLRPGGCFVAPTGSDDWTGTEGNWLGSGGTCGGATRTPPPTVSGSPAPASRSNGRTSYRRATAGTPCSGHVVPDRLVV